MHGVRQQSSKASDPSNVRRRLLIIAILLLAGAVVNVAVAWACAFLVDVWALTDKTGFVSGEGQMWEVTTFSRAGAFSVFSSRSKLESVEDMKVGEDPGALIPSWTPFLTPTASFASGKSSYDNRGAEGRGWPLLALWYEEWGPGRD